MEKYFAYGLSIKSDIELPVYPEPPNRKSFSNFPSVNIRREPLERSNLLRYNNDGDYLAGVASDTLLFHVIGGDTILFDPLPGADRRFIQAVLGGELMAALLRQRGILPLHASCVSKQGQSIAFVGDSGWGKSTLAIFFAREGYSLVADDILALDLNGDHPTIHPSPPYVRLQPDAGDKFISGYDQLPVSHSRTTKRHLIFDSSFCNKKTSLRKIYFLEKVKRNENSVETIAPSLATVKLINLIRAKRLTTSPEYAKDNLNKCSYLTSSVESSILRRKLSLEEITDTKKTIEEDISLWSEA
jgi:hypothetical protein